MRPWLPLALTVLLALQAPGVLAGGDEDQPQPPTGSPPGPWDNPQPTKGRYTKPRTVRCALGPVREAGPGTVLGLYAEGVRCSAADRLVRHYQRCLSARAGSTDPCYSRIYRRCVQPVFLGRCRTRDRFFQRRIGRFVCTERRLYPIGAKYDATVTCGDGGLHRIDHAYSLFEGDSATVVNERQLRSAWANPRFRRIDVTRNIVLRACRTGDPIRESPTPMLLDGNGHTLRQTCFEKRLLRQDGTGFLELRRVTLTRGGSDGPGAAVTTRGEIRIVDSKIHDNLAEEPGGGVMSQRRATIIHSVITGNLANDDGGGVYARRGGIQVYDSVVSSNLVDGSGGALGSTGDILVVRSHIDGNTTDGDGGAIYTDEDGDVTVIDSTVNGSTADGPGGAIFTLDGEVTVVNSTLNGNRADDRGGAISGESNVKIYNSTIARNAAVAHVGGGIWARGDLYVANSTISNNYAEGQGGGVLATGTVGLVHATVTENTAPVAANVGAGGRLESFGSIIGPAKVDVIGGQAQPTGDNCQVAEARSYGFNLITDSTCKLSGPGDLVGVPARLGPLAGHGGIGETRLPQPGSRALGWIPIAHCRFVPFGEVLEGEQHLAAHVGDVAGLMVRDQRGFPRTKGTACDVGATENAG